jgi:hypothetical protein
MGGHVRAEKSGVTCVVTRRFATFVTLKSMLLARHRRANSNILSTDNNNKSFRVDRRVECKVHEPRPPSYLFICRLPALVILALGLLSPTTAGRAGTFFCHAV